MQHHRKCYAGFWRKSWGSDLSNRPVHIMAQRSWWTARTKITKTGQSLITVLLGGRGTIHWWILFFLFFFVCFGGGRVRDLQTPLPHGLLKEKQKQAKTVILGVGVGKRPWMKTRMKTVMMKMRMKTVYLVRCGQLAYPPVDVMTVKHWFRNNKNKNNKEKSVKNIQTQHLSPFGCTPW